MPLATRRALLGAALAAPAAALPPERLDQLADAVRADVVEWRRDFHRHPELGNQETRTA